MSLKNISKTNKVSKAFKVRIYPNENQKAKIEQHFGTSRFIYNQLLAIKNYTYNSGCGVAPPKNYETQLKEVYPFLKEVDSTSLQQSRRNLDKSFKAFFKGTSSFPKFHSKKNDNHSYKTMNKVVDLENNKIYLPKIGNIKFRTKYIFPDKLNILSKTVSSKGDKYFVSLTCKEVEINNKNKTGSSIGIDLGLKTLATLSTGEKFNHTVKNRNDKIVKYSKILSRRTKNSKNWLRTRTKLQNSYLRKSELIKDFQHWLSNKIITEHDNVFAGDVNSQLVLKNKKLSRTGASQAWFQFKTFLEYKSEWYGKVFKVVNERNTTKTCSTCGFIDEPKPLSVRSWICPSCHTKHDRDVNAALNILTVGATGIACGKSTN